PRKGDLPDSFAISRIMTQGCHAPRGQTAHHCLTRACPKLCRPQETVLTNLCSFSLQPTRKLERGLTGQDKGFPVIGFHRKNEPPGKNIQASLDRNRSSS